MKHLTTVTNENKQLENFVNLVINDLHKTEDVTNKFDENFITNFCIKKNAEGFDNKQIAEFFQSCQLTGADPRKKDAYLVGFKVKGIQNHSIIHSYHYLLKQANKTGKLKGVQCKCEVREDFDPITGLDVKQLVAIATVHKNGNDEPTVFEAYWSEFVKEKFIWINGKKTTQVEVISTWKDKPRVMLQKCAIANAMRWAFPESLENIYITEERSDIDLGKENQITEEEKKSSINAEYSTPNENKLNIEVQEVKTCNLEENSNKLETRDMFEENASFKLEGNQ